MLAEHVVPDANAVAVAHDVLRPVRRLPGALSWPLEAFTVGLLPPSIRHALGPPRRRPERVWFRAVIAALRLLVPLLPARIRVVPQARRHRSRIA